MREDYSGNGDAWRFFPHDQARSRAYRWGEDGLAGLSDNHQRLCVSLALWNGKDRILKERLYGLTNHEGNKKNTRPALGFVSTVFLFVGCLTNGCVPIFSYFVEKKITFLYRQPW